jgi:hypothetical protein
MTEVPAATPVTNPDVELMVATAGVAEDQAPPVTEEVSVEVPLEQIAVVPEIVPAVGAAVTVPVNETVCAEAPVEVILNEPFTLPTEAVLVSLTNTFVADKVPLAVIVTELAYPEPELKLTSYPVGATTDTLAVKLVPEILMV